jgi:hypothetical protein
VKVYHFRHADLQVSGLDEAEPAALVVDCRCNFCGELVDHVDFGPPPWNDGDVKALIQRDKELAGG